jgi:hypothetical protein
MAGQRPRRLVYIGGWLGTVGEQGAIQPQRYAETLGQLPMTCPELVAERSIRSCERPVKQRFRGDYQLFWRRPEQDPAAPVTARAGTKQSVAVAMGR